MSRRSAPWAAVVLGAVLAVAAGLQPGAAFAAGDSTSSWVAYGPPQPGSTVEVVQGKADGQGGCVLDLAAALSPSESAARADEVAFNQSTCQSQVAITRGGAVAPDPPDPSGASSSSSGPVAPAAPSTAPPPKPAAPSVTSAGYYKSWYEDPVGIVVNSVKDSTKWRWNRVCATGIYGSWSYTWFTFWSLGANNAQNTYDCNRTTVSSYAHFHNRPFCHFSATDTYYNRNNVHGRYDGYLLGDVHARKTGQCTFLLSFHASLRRTQN